MIRSLGSFGSYGSHGRKTSSSYEPIDSYDVDDQNTQAQVRGSRANSYRKLVDEDSDEEEEHNILKMQKKRRQTVSDYDRDYQHQHQEHASVRSFPSWTGGDEQKLSFPRSTSPHSAAAAAAAAIEPQSPLIRSVSRKGSVLSHPTPDLQSIQGAYLSNVTRLEESAERLSLSGSDIGEELRKMQLEQKRADSRRSSVRMPPSRQFSSSSQTNSIIGLNSVARSGGFSHEGYVTSSSMNTKSMRSPSWSQHDPSSQRDQLAQREPLQEGKPLDSPISVRSNVLTVRNQDKVERDDSLRDDSLQNAVEGYADYAERGDKSSSIGSSNRDKQNIQRNASTATNSTYRQAQDAFADFDGVHISGASIEEVQEPTLQQPHPPPPPPQEQLQPLYTELEPLSLNMSLSPVDRGMNFSPSYAESLQSYTRMPEAGETGMVYYPAPVPMMLNLPQKLSKNISQQKLAQRRSQFMLPKRKSVQNLADVLEINEEMEGEETKKLPPQLRATMFFDHPAIPHNIEIKDGSAVKTLDSILDASAFAPVTAFTDHPIVGQVGADEVYKREKSERRLPQRRSQSTTDVQKTDEQEEKRKSFLGFGKKKRSSSAMLTKVNTEKEMDKADDAEEDSPLAGAHDEDRLEDEIEDHEAEIEEDLRKNRPTTLMGELQVRKLEQSRRNRTAAAHPDGMRSTLLQLDAVTQHQIQSRKQKQITLAWENPANADEPEPDDTEDVPLGMLFPTTKLAANSNKLEEDRPLGLLAQRHMEDAEPLSHRRARLRGEPKPQSAGRRSPMGFPGGPGPEPPMTSQQAEEEEETLAQRKRRLAIKDAIPVARPVSGAFSSEMLSEMGLEEKKPPAATPDPDETLGQRKKRLQAEREAAQLSADSEQLDDAVADRRKSMADILTAHPAGRKPSNRDTMQSRGLLALADAHKHSSILGNPWVRNTSSGSHSGDRGMLNMAMGSAQQPQRAPSLAPGYYMPMGQKRSSQRLNSNPFPQQIHDQQQQFPQQQQSSTTPGYFFQNHTQQPSYPSLSPNYNNSTQQQSPYTNTQGYFHSPQALQSMLQTQAGQSQYVNPMTYAPMMGINGGHGPVPAYTQAGLDHVPLNPRQREVIDRWRQSVV